MHSKITSEVTKRLQLIAFEQIKENPDQIAIQHHSEIVDQLFPTLTFQDCIAKNAVNKTLLQLLIKANIPSTAVAVKNYILKDELNITQYIDTAVKFKAGHILNLLTATPSHLHPLYLAVIQGKNTQVKTTLKQKITTRQVQSALNYAASLGHFDIYITLSDHLQNRQSIHFFKITATRMPSVSKIKKQFEDKTVFILFKERLYILYQNTNNIVEIEKNTANIQSYNQLKTLFQPHRIVADSNDKKIINRLLGADNQIIKTDRSNLLLSAYITNELAIFEHCLALIIQEESANEFLSFLNYLIDKSSHLFKKTFLEKILQFLLDQEVNVSITAKLITLFLLKYPYKSQAELVASLLVFPAVTELLVPASDIIRKIKLDLSNIITQYILNYKSTNRVLINNMLLTQTLHCDNIYDKNIIIKLIKNIIKIPDSILIQYVFGHSLFNETYEDINGNNLLHLAAMENLTTPFIRMQQLNPSLITRQNNAGIYPYSWVKSHTFINRFVAFKWHFYRQVYTDIVLFTVENPEEMLQSKWGHLTSIETQQLSTMQNQLILIEKALQVGVIDKEVIYETIKLLQNILFDLLENTLEPKNINTTAITKLFETIVTLQIEDTNFPLDKIILNKLIILIIQYCAPLSSIKLLENMSPSNYVTAASLFLAKFSLIIAESTHLDINKHTTSMFCYKNCFSTQILEISIIPLLFIPSIQELSSEQLNLFAKKLQTLQLYYTATEFDNHLDFKELMAELFSHHQFLTQLTRPLITILEDNNYGLDKKLGAYFALKTIVIKLTELFYSIPRAPAFLADLDEYSKLESKITYINEICAIYDKQFFIQRSEFYDILAEYEDSEFYRQFKEELLAKESDPAYIEYQKNDLKTLLSIHEKLNQLAENAHKDLYNLCFLCQKYCDYLKIDFEEQAVQILKKVAIILQDFRPQIGMLKSYKLAKIEILNLKECLLLSLAKEQTLIYQKNYKLCLDLVSFYDSSALSSEKDSALFAKINQFLKIYHEKMRTTDNKEPIDLTAFVESQLHLNLLEKLKEKNLQYIAAIKHQNDLNIKKESLQTSYDSLEEKAEIIGVAYHKAEDKFKTIQQMVAKQKSELETCKNILYTTIYEEKVYNEALCLNQFKEKEIIYTMKLADLKASDEAFNSLVHAVVISKKEEKEAEQKLASLYLTISELQQTIHKKSTLIEKDLRPKLTQSLSEEREAKQRLAQAKKLQKKLERHRQNLFQKNSLASNQFGMQTQFFWQQPQKVYHIYSIEKQFIELLFANTSAAHTIFIQLQINTTNINILAAHKMQEMKTLKDKIQNFALEHFKTFKKPNPGEDTKTDYYSKQSLGNQWLIPLLTEYTNRINIELEAVNNYKENNRSLINNYLSLIDEFRTNIDCCYLHMIAIAESFFINNHIENSEERNSNIQKILFSRQYQFLSLFILNLKQLEQQLTSEIDTHQIQVDNLLFWKVTLEIVLKNYQKQYDSESLHLNKLAKTQNNEEISEWELQEYSPLKIEFLTFLQNSLEFINQLLQMDLEKIRQLSYIFEQNQQSIKLTSGKLSNYLLLQPELNEQQQSNDLGSNFGFGT